MGRKKNEITLKEPVRIREKELKDGNKSLYLDIYMNGNRKLHRAGSECCIKTTEQEHLETCRADQGTAHPRHPEGWHG